ncbi:MAG: 2,3-diketo-5-methylthiopentyl-1-phosphate enolase [Thermobacillus sp. ZCTH02-B1]|uniref:2,3-diketo-5-methylthiopentyl-1-phosphate enolase n=1 Tax=Thermobacillus sp. ZCTH02-B1 TaxID=1858795 RepID=UPI000B574913|nr:2,3-diketo-5-methylthiopentyl-1-phosphate enolase [Thermobacillus sp. ZCTH02-B1]OUM96740.1 MAG: 2,3-diketo-5-methylthiopentyl-1-phosphate enolase [Thermobacillus sp. ZCTH02-B1]
MGGYCRATYRLYDEKADFEKKAQSIAVGLTVGSWTDLPQARKAEMEKHLGRVVSVTEVPAADSPTGERYADIVIDYPDINFSRDIPALLVTVFGKLSMDGRIKLLDIGFSDDFLSAFPGPKFGIEGVRRLLGVHDRPLLMSIFKSVIGHDLANLREQFLLQALGGVDLVKDDEILFENPLTPLEKRVETCMAAAEEAKRATGQELLYAVNLTGPTFKLAENAKRAIRAGANALLFNVLAYGFDALAELARDPEINVPIAAHPAISGAIYPSRHYGIAAPLLLGKLMRLAGADLVLFPSPYGSVVMPKEDTKAVKNALTTGELPLRSSFPVPSAGIHPGLVPLLHRDFGPDVVVNAGGGIHGHPLGTSAGGRAFRQAIDAVMAGVPLVEAAKRHDELRAAVEAWGIRE